MSGPRLVVVMGKEEEREEEKDHFQHEVDSVHTSNGSQATHWSSLSTKPHWVATTDRAGVAISFHTTSAIISAWIQHNLTQCNLCLTVESVVTLRNHQNWMTTLGIGKLAVTERRQVPLYREVTCSYSDH